MPAYEEYMIFYVFRRVIVAIPTPTKMMVESIINLRVKGSEMKIIPPKAAMTGTVSCAMPARVAVRCLRAMYQITYPSAEVIVPEVSARMMPLVFGVLS